MVVNEVHRAANDVQQRPRIYVHLHPERFHHLVPLARGLPDVVHGVSCPSSELEEGGKGEEGSGGGWGGQQECRWWGISRKAVAAALPDAYFYADRVVLPLHQMLQARGRRLCHYERRLAGNSGTGCRRSA